MNEEWKDLLTMQEVAEAQAQGWEIQTDAGTNTFAGWIGESWYDRWQFRGRPRQPAMKKVKSLCWMYTDGDFAWRTEGVNLAKPWIRVPSEDKEIEVPE